MKDRIIALVQDPDVLEIVLRKARALKELMSPEGGDALHEATASLIALEMTRLTIESAVLETDLLTEEEVRDTELFAKTMVEDAIAKEG